METPTILKDYTDREKGAYLGAIASLATADHAASEEEITHITALADSAGISEEQKKMVERAATEMEGDELVRCLEILKTSELRFTLIAELISFAKADGLYNEQEKAKIEQIAEYLGINEKQFSLLDHFVNKTTDSNIQPEQKTSMGFLESLGLGDKFKEQGINMSGLGKSLMALAAPLLLGKLFMGGNRRNIGMSQGRMGGLGGGGLGSLLSALNMGRGFGRTGGLLGKILGGRSF
jgi:uncharacterized tellurite resistance protein B-like protein